MADKSLIQKGFNNQFEEFVNDVSTLFPENKDVKSAKTALGLLRKGNPKMLITLWYQFICVKYEDQINDGNLEYFFNKDYSEDLKMGQDSNAKVLEAIDKLRAPLKELENENKDKCIQYLKNLNQLSKIYIN